jgi:UDPglucose--hexose-1-phosphate uridylyltransferase
MPELRKDPIIREWVIIATERAKRPSDFRQTEPTYVRPPHDPGCPFCPGNEHMTPPEVLAYRPPGSEANSGDWWVRVVPNKFPALAIEGGLSKRAYGMYDAMNGVGAHEVIIESPEHDQSPATLTRHQLEETLWACRDRYLDLRRDQRFKYILIFRNHGRVAGASLDHPHSQLIATPMVPSEVVTEMEGAHQYYDYHDRCIFCDMCQQELDAGERVVTENAGFVAFVPFASKVPFEVWIMPKEHTTSFASHTREQMAQFAEVFQESLQRINWCLNCPPYNYSIHTAPLREEVSEFYHWHVQILPRLTIAAGFEMGTGIYINVSRPEEAAKFLREATPPAAPTP